MPRIPMDPSDLPSSSERFEPLDESLTYTAVVELLGEGSDKNGHVYINVRHRITEPAAYEGRIIYDPYIVMPWKAAPDANEVEIKRAARSGDRLGDITRSAGIKGGRPEFDTDELLGCTVSFTVRNELWQDQIRSKPNNYLLRS